MLISHFFNSKVDTLNFFFVFKSQTTCPYEKENFSQRSIDNFVFFNIRFVFLVALQALKRKKRYEEQLLQLQGTLTTIETQREALESANTNAAVLDTMKQAADSLKKTHKDM